MSEKIRSGISFHGSRMRYAEVEQTGAALRLVRLGSCDFDFDAEKAALEGTPSRLDIIRQAVSDVFSGTRSIDFTVVLPPRSVISFFSPVSDRAPEAEKKRQLEADIILVGGRDSALSVSAEPVFSENAGGEDVTWYQVAAIQAPVRRNMAGVLSDFSGVNNHFMTSMQAATRVAAWIEDRRAGSGAGTVAAAVGCYDDCTEISILDAGRWRHGVCSKSTLASDVAYALLDELERLDLSAGDLNTVYVYGDRTNGTMATALAAATNAAVTILDPLALFDNHPVDERSSFEPGQYVLAVGASL